LDPKPSARAMQASLVFLGLLCAAQAVPDAAPVITLGLDGTSDNLCFEELEWESLLDSSSTTGFNAAVTGTCSGQAVNIASKRCNVGIDTSVTCPVPTAKAYDHHEGHVGTNTGSCDFIDPTCDPSSGSCVSSTATGVRVCAEAGNGFLREESKIFVKSQPGQEPQKMANTAASVVAIDWNQRGAYLMRYDAQDLSVNAADSVNFVMIMQDHAGPISVSFAYDGQTGTSTASSTASIALEAAKDVSVTFTETDLGLSSVDVYDGSITDASKFTFSSTTVSRHLSDGVAATTALSVTATDYADIFGVSDADNNQPYTINVVVTDTTPPDVTCANCQNVGDDHTYTIECDASHTGVVASNVNAACDDLNDGVFSAVHSTTTDPSYGTHGSTGTITFSCTDQASHVTTESIRLLVDDTSPPVVTATSDPYNIIQNYQCGYFYHQAMLSMAAYEGFTITHTKECGTGGFCEVRLYQMGGSMTVPTLSGAESMCDHATLRDSSDWTLIEPFSGTSGTEFYGVDVSGPTFTHDGTPDGWEQRFSSWDQMTGKTYPCASDPSQQCGWYAMEYNCCDQPTSINGATACAGNTANACRYYEVADNSVYCGEPDYILQYKYELTVSRSLFYHEETSHNVTENSVTHHDDTCSCPDGFANGSAECDDAIRYCRYEDVSTGTVDIFKNYMTTALSSFCDAELTSAMKTELLSDIVTVVEAIGFESESTEGRRLTESDLDNIRVSGEIHIPKLNTQCDVMAEIANAVEHAMEEIGLELRRGSVGGPSPPPALPCSEGGAEFPCSCTKYSDDWQVEPNYFPIGVWTNGTFPTAGEQICDGQCHDSSGNSPQKFKICVAGNVGTRSYGDCNDQACPIDCVMTDFPNVWSQCSGECVLARQGRLHSGPQLRL